MKVIDGDSLHTSIVMYIAENAYLNDTPQSVLEMVAKWVEEAPGINITPAVHARWIEIGKNEYRKVCACSHCLAKYDFTSSYCPNCGANMDG